MSNTRTQTLTLVTSNGLPEVRTAPRPGYRDGKVLARGSSLVDRADNAANAAYVRLVTGQPHARVIIDGELFLRGAR